MMESNYEQIKKEIEKLKYEIKLVSIRKIEAEKYYPEIDRETEKKQEANQKLSFREQAFKTEADTWKDILYKLAHSINNDLHNAAQILKSKDSDEELTNAFYHIKRIDDLVKLNLWLLKKNELPEEWKTIDLSKDIDELIASTKRGLSTLRVSAEFQIKLAQLNVITNYTGNSTITSMREKLDTVISIILQDLIRNAFKYSDSNNPVVEVTIDGSSEDEVKIVFMNNKIMDDRFVRYINFRDTEPDISDSSKVGLRSILDWVKIISGMQITCSNNLSQNKCEIELIIPRNVDYENN